MRRSSCRRDDDLAAASLDVRDVLLERVRRAVRREHSDLVRDLERPQRLGGVLHRLPVGGRAHDHRGQRAHSGSLISAPSFRLGLSFQRRLHDPGSLAHVGIHVVPLRDALEELDRVAVSGAVLQADDGQATDGEVRVPRGKVVEERAVRVDVSGMATRKSLPTRSTPSPEPPGSRPRARGGGAEASAET